MLTDEEVSKMTQDVYDRIAKCRDELTAFYDGRVVFACFADILGSLGAALIHTKLMPMERVASALTDVIGIALTRKSETQLVVLRTEVDKGGKQ